MESSLVFDRESQSLGLAFKERLRESENEVELKVSGLLNTKTGRLDGVGSLRKFVFLGGQLPGRNPYLRPAAEKRRTRSVHLRENLTRHLGGHTTPCCRRAGLSWV